jgi:hypothetical protein
MQEIDYNWEALKQEHLGQSSIQDTKHRTFQQAEKFVVTRWFNNFKNYKITWREGVVKHDAWFDYKEDKGLWTHEENRLWEEIQYLHRNSDITVTRQCARTDQYKNLKNIKMIEVLAEGYKPVESILIVDHQRIFTATPTRAKDRYSYHYK